jgi:hypothetical protein
MRVTPRGLSNGSPGAEPASPARLLRHRSAGDDELPQLGDVRPAGEQRRSDAARRIHRGVGHRNSDQLNQRQRQPDWDRGEPGRRRLVGAAEDHGQEEGRSHELGDEAGDHIVLAWVEIAVAISGEAVDERETLTAAGDQVEQRRNSLSAENIRYRELTHAASLSPPPR